jgi:hypothetical protein
MTKRGNKEKAAPKAPKKVSLAMARLPGRIDPRQAADQVSSGSAKCTFPVGLERAR